MSLVRLSSGLGIGAALLAIAALAPPSAHAQRPDTVARTVRLNDTGLGRCTTDFLHFTHDCAGTGQDAETGRDALHPADGDGDNGFVFTKVCNSGALAGEGTCSAQAALGPGPDDWGCTLDRMTGLVWEVKTPGSGPRGADVRYTNTGGGSPDDTGYYVAAVNVAGLCGAIDWRLPTTHELQGLVDFNRASPHPSIDEAFFPNTPAGTFWTSEGYAGQAASVAWVVSFLMDPSNIDVVGQRRDGLASARLVHAGGRAAAMAAATAPARIGGTPEHLVWRRCVEGQAWDGAHCTGLATLYSFGGAIAHAAAVATQTGEAWRVPNAKELFSLVVTERRHPAIDTRAFPDTPDEKLWTSTAYAWTATGGWVVDFDGGEVLAYYGGFGFPVRLVRDAD